MSPTDAELVQHLRGASTPADARRVDDWLSESDENGRRLDALRRIWNASRTRNDTDVDAIWTSVAERTLHSEARRDVRPAPVPRLALARPAPERAPILPIIAAAAVIVAAAVTFVYIERQRIPTTAAAVIAATPAREYSTGRGERSTIHLADGSTVTLAPLTHVRVLPAFGIPVRELAIQGEAILDVVHDASHPFRVMIGNAIAEDAGTRFAVRALSGDTSVSVAVAEGAVSLACADSTERRTVLRAASVGRLDSQCRIATEAAVNLGAYFGWADGHLAFDDVPLAEVQRTLARWYDVDLRVEDAALRDRRVTARMDGQDVRAMVNALAVTLGADVSWQGTNATLRSH